jgi:hypothetical protein
MADCKFGFKERDLPDLCFSKAEVEEGDGLSW